MKNTPLILSIVSLVAVAAMGIILLTNGNSNKPSTTGDPETEGSARQGDVVFFNLDKVLEEYDMANELRSAAQSKIQSIQEEVNRRGNRLQNEVNSFNDKINKGLMTRSTAETQSQQLAQKQQEFQNYAAQKEQEIAEEQQVMLNQIGDAIKTFIDKYNAEKKYAMIIASQGDILPQPIVAGDASLDITEEIITLLNDEYVKNKAAENAKSE